jgi:ABC-2 type transport system permease protein
MNATAGPREPEALTANGGQRSGYGALIVQFALKDFKIRYTHSLLGYIWSVINPLMFFAIYYVVFSVFMHFDIPNYPGFLLIGVALWNFFSEGTTSGSGALLSRADILSKMVLPRQVVVYGALLSAGLTFAINLVVLMIVLWATGTTLKWPAICFIPLLIDLVALTAGIALLLAPLYVRYRDIGYLWNIVLQVGFWLTPIIYLDLMIPARWQWIVWVNPVGRIIGDSRRALVWGLWPGPRGMLITTAYSLGIAVLGAMAFRRLQGRIVEYL